MTFHGPKLGSVMLDTLLRLAVKEPREDLVTDAATPFQVTADIVGAATTSTLVVPFRSPTCATCQHRECEGLCELLLNAPKLG